MDCSCATRSRRARGRRARRAAGAARSRSGSHFHAGYTERHGGQPVARSVTLPVSLPVPDENGVIDRIAQLTLEPLPVGNFTLQLIVNESGDEIVREVPVQVVE